VCSSDLKKGPHSQHSRWHEFSLTKTL